MRKHDKILKREDGVAKLYPSLIEASHCQFALLGFVSRSDAAIPE